MDENKVRNVERLIKEFLESAPTRRREVSVTFDANKRTHPNEGRLSIDTGIGKEDELDVLEQEKNGFIIYNIVPHNTRRNRKPKIAIDIRVPDELPQKITF